MVNLQLFISKNKLNTMISVWNKIIPHMVKVVELVDSAKFITAITGAQSTLPLIGRQSYENSVEVLEVEN